MNHIAVQGLLVLCFASIEAFAQIKPSKPKADANEIKIARALSAAPANIAKSAKVVDRDAEGTETTLRDGTNGFTCFPGHPGVIGDAPLCADGPALQWEIDMAQHKPKPTNTAPGIEYMLAAATDWSGTDPHATSGTPIKEPPHWMIMWPVDAASGLPTTVKQTGTWIMYAGTPWAHLMINQRP
jgi:hypothetical protein